MNPTTLSTLAAVIILAGSTIPANAQLGIAGGLNFESLGDIELQSGKTTFDNATGYHFGVFFDLNAAPIAVRPGVFIRNLGNLEFGFEDVIEDFDLTLIEVPIDVRLPLLHAPIVKPYLLAGPVLAFPRTGNSDVEDSLENLALSASVGVGLQVDVPAVGLRLYPELRYGFGISRLIRDSFEIGGVMFDARNDARLNSFIVRLGIGL